MRAVLKQFGPPPYVGVTWRGGLMPGEPVPQRGTYLQKTIAPDELGRGLAATDARIVILQRKPAPADVQSFVQALGRPALDLSAINDELRDALAVLSLLDDYIGSRNCSIFAAIHGGQVRGRDLSVDHLSDLDWPHDS